jgi:hypothetical protein
VSLCPISCPNIAVPAVSLVLNTQVSPSAHGKPGSTSAHDPRLSSGAILSLETFSP